MPVHIRQPEVAALVSIGQPLVVDAQQVEDRGVHVVDVHRAGGPFVHVGLRAHG